MRGMNVGGLDGRLRCLLGQRCGRFAGAGDAPGTNAGASANPLVRRWRRSDSARHSSSRDSVAPSPSRRSVRNEASVLYSASLWPYRDYTPLRLGWAGHPLVSTLGESGRLGAGSRDNPRRGNATGVSSPLPYSRVVGSNPSCVLGPAEKHGTPRPLPHRNPYLRSGLPAATPCLVVNRILATVIFAVDGEPPSFPATGRRARHRTGLYFQLAALTVPFVLSGSPARIVGHSNVSDPPIATMEGIPPHCIPFAGGPTTPTTAISRHCPLLRPRS